MPILFSPGSLLGKSQIRSIEKEALTGQVAVAPATGRAPGGETEGIDAVAVACWCENMVVVGKHFTFLHIVVLWLKSKSTELLKSKWLLPFQRQPR